MPLLPLDAGTSFILLLLSLFSYPTITTTTTADTTTFPSYLLLLSQILLSFPNFLPLCL